MSRTLHYGIDKNYSPDDKQAYDLFKRVHEYNNKYEWTAEKIDLCEYRIYLANEYLGSSHSKDADEILYPLVQQLIEQGMRFHAAIKSLADEGLISFRKKESLKGFTKVSSNELNAHAVINFVIEVSKLIPEAVFYLIDEGYALYCDLQIKDGLAKPHYENLAEYLKNMDTDRDLDIKHKIDYFRHLLESRPDYADPSKYIRPLLNEGYLRDRIAFQTKVLKDDNIHQLGELISQMASSEKEESGKYYEDIKKFPSE